MNKIKEKGGAAVEDRPIIRLDEEIIGKIAAGDALTIDGIRTAVEGDGRAVFLLEPERQLH